MPVSGVLLPGIGDPPGGRGGCFAGNAVFTFHLADSVPFRERILVTVEHGTENNMSNDYASTAYWYGQAGDEDFFFMRPVEERMAILPEHWEGLHKKARQQYGAQLRRQLADVVAAVKNHPTDAQRYGYRRMILVRTTRNGAPLGLSAEEGDKYFQRWMSFRKSDAKTEWLGTDKVLLELGERLLGSEP